MVKTLKARCVLAEARWSLTLKVLSTGACIERALCADPMLLTLAFSRPNDRSVDSISRLDCCVIDRAHDDLEHVPTKSVSFFRDML